MSVQFKGVKSIIQTSALDLQPIRNYLGVIEKLYCFYNTPKCKNALFEAINNGDSTPSTRSLKLLCATRWVQRYDAVNDFVQLFLYVVASLENMGNWKDVTAVDANMLKNAMDSEFLVSEQIIKVI